MLHQDLEVATGGFLGSIGEEFMSEKSGKADEGRAVCVGG